MGSSCLTITEEKDRANRFISSLLFSRATVFHPSNRLTTHMKDRLMAVASSGGTNLNIPLESVIMNSYGKQLRVDLHVDYLLQPHRDILETILAYGKTMQLDDETYESGGNLSWHNVFKTIENGCEPKITPDGFDSHIDREATVISMSMYELATRMNMAPTRANYDQIERRIVQLKTAMLLINEIDSDGDIIDRKPLSFISDFRFYCDFSKFKGCKPPSKIQTNHVFIIPDFRLLESIRDYGYYYRLEQFKMSHYSKPSVRSFLKYIKTHEMSFVNNKKLDWAIDSYINSIASKVSHSFRSDLRKDLLLKSATIHEDFGYQFIVTDEKEIKIVCDENHNMDQE